MKAIIYVYTKSCSVEQVIIKQHKDVQCVIEISSVQHGNPMCSKEIQCAARKSHVQQGNPLCSREIQCAARKSNVQQGNSVCSKEIHCAAKNYFDFEYVRARKISVKQKFLCILQVLLVNESKEIRG